MIPAGHRFPPFLLVAGLAFQNCAAHAEHDSTLQWLAESGITFFSVKKWIGGFVEDYLLKAGIETMPRGQTTMRLALKEAGAEPDESWCLGHEKAFPDLVLEIALTSGGVNKLEILAKT